jgi:hypothetical protein
MSVFTILAAGYLKLLVTYGNFIFLTARRKTMEENQASYLRIFVFLFLTFLRQMPWQYLEIGYCQLI